MVARLSERELIQVAITKKKAPFGLYSCAVVQAGFGKVKKVLTRLTTSTHWSSLEDEEIDEAIVEEKKFH